MLEDVLKTKNVEGKTVSLLLYNIDKIDRYYEDNRNHYYEIRISNNDKLDTFEIYAENYIKRESIKIFNQACKQVVIDQIEHEAKIAQMKRKWLENERNQNNNGQRILYGIYDKSTRRALWLLGKRNC